MAKLFTEPSSVVVVATPLTRSGGGDAKQTMPKFGMHKNKVINQSSAHNLPTWWLEVALIDKEGGG
jgi:hypothetical protein